MNGPPLLKVSGIAKRFDGLVATDHVSLEQNAGEVHALIGPNGAGKSTFVNLLCGSLRPDAGTIKLDGADIGHLSTVERVHRGLSRTFQITQLLLDYSVLENVQLAVQSQAGHSFRFFKSARYDAKAMAAAMACLVRVGLCERAKVRVADLAQGERKQLELAIALAAKPRLLLLDEPMAGLSALDSQNMVALLQSLKTETTIFIVEHDMNAVFALADRISVLVNGRILMSGTAAEVKASDDVRRAYLGEGDV